MPLIANAQTSYRNLDAGRPLRVEDALVTPRGELDVQLPSPRVDAFGSGLQRWRVDPKLAYGVFPFTELEVRVPVLYLVPPAGAGVRALGVGGVAISATHAFSLETPVNPGLSVAAELLTPAGSLAAPHATYAFKMISTRTFAAVRTHFNAAWGNYSVRGNGADTTCVPRRFPAPGSDPGCGAAQIPDFPCSKGASDVMSLCIPLPLPPAPPVTPKPLPTSGVHWSAALGADHSFALSSTLIGADVVAEQFVGLYAKTDWTVEIGARHQVNPFLVIDAGVARHFVGVLQSSGITIGGSYAISIAR
jgi:hypothetical protein